MKLQFLGATGTVTGSKYLVQHGDARVLVDCGLFQGFKQLRLRNWSALPVEPERIDAVVLTHAHIDHSGYLPLLVRNGFRGRVFASRATRDLCRIMLPDSGGLHEEEAAYLNRHQMGRHHPNLPLYTREDAIRCLKQFEPLGWDTPHTVAHGITATMRPVGHMPGAASVLLRAGGKSLAFSGDVGRPNDVLMRPPQPAFDADYLVVESTYGDREHKKLDVLDQLADVINRTSARGGTVLIPAFAVGRAQALLHCIQVLKAHKRIHALPVYLNSPMASDAMEVFLHHPEALRLDAHSLQAMGHAATIVRTREESEALNARRGPMVIIAGSGMATGGRIVHHLKSFAPDHRNTVLLAGFQAGGTRGAALAAGERSVRIHGEDVPVRCEVAQLDAVSGHADASELLDWLRPMRPPRRTFITHGEPAAADAMRLRIERMLGWEVQVPEYLETVTLH
jgi:metallo-beta-lactamase family protein